MACREERERERHGPLEKTNNVLSPPRLPNACIQAFGRSGNSSSDAVSRGRRNCFDPSLKKTKPKNVKKRTTQTQQNATKNVTTRAKALRSHVSCPLNTPNKDSKKGYSVDDNNAPTPNYVFTPQQRTGSKSNTNQHPPFSSCRPSPPFPPVPFVLFSSSPSNASPFGVRAKSKRVLPRR